MDKTLFDDLRQSLMEAQAIARGRASAPPPLVPNTATTEAMQAARRGELVTAGSLEQLSARLQEDDEEGA